MATWYLDEGLARFEREWKAAHPGAVVYSIGDSQHSTNPNVTQHAPDWGGSAPGDDKGEVDAVDVMPGNGVTAADLDELFEALIRSRDPRILYVIHHDVIVSSVVSPWTKRHYSGEFHDHVHLSVNDKYDANSSDWKWEAMDWTYTTLSGKLPKMRKGDEDAAHSGWNHVGRAQALINWLEHTLPPLDADGVYGAKTAQKLAKVMAPLHTKTSTDGSRLEEPEWRTLIGFSA